MLKGAFKFKCMLKSLTVTGFTSARASSTKADVLFKNKLKELNDEKVSEAENSLELIFANVLNKKQLREVRGELLEKIDLNEEQIQDIEEKVHLRLSRVPVQYILGRWEFRDIELKMRPPTFIPRPETEELCELISQQIDKTKNYDILEIGTGTGAISLALASELPNIKKIIAIDQSKMACDLATENATKLNLLDRVKIINFKLESDTLPAEIGSNPQFDIIVSNPPYIPTKDLLKLQPEIYLYENIKALDGGKEGLDVIKLLLSVASKYLRKGGHLWIEVDSRHSQIIEKIVQNNQEEWKLNFVASYKDIFKKDRFVEIQKM